MLLLPESKKRVPVMKRPTLLILGLVALVALDAQAHTRLTASTPADAALTSSPPEQIVLEFNAEVRLLAVTLEHHGGEAVELGSVPGDARQAFTVAMPAELAPGEYVVTWRAVGADTHVVSGEIHFVVAA